MKTRDMIEIMQHYADGGTVEMRAYCGDHSLGWTEVPSIYYCEWDWTRFEFRIKPERRAVPRDRWLVNNGLLETPFDSLHEATAMAALCEGYVTHYREVV